MNSKVEKVFDKILSDGSICKEFLKLQTVEEMYELFLEIDDSISKEEFDEFASVALQNYEKTSSREIFYKELKNVAGGNLGIKVASGILSALTLVPSFGNFSAKGTGITDTASELFVNAKNKAKNASYYVVQTAKSGFIKTADWIKNNPRKAAFIASAIIVGGLVHKHRQSKAERARQEAEERARQEAEERARQEAEERARQEIRRRTEEKRIRHEEARREKARREKARRAAEKKRARQEEIRRGTEEKQIRHEGYAQQAEGSVNELQPQQAAEAERSRQEAEASKKRASGRTTFWKLLSDLLDRLP